MFDFADLFDWGREVEVDGHKWQIIKSLPQPYYYLAIHSRSKLPSAVHIIYYKPEKPEETK